MSNTPRNIIVHHSAAKNPTPQLDAINQWHKDRDFPLSQLGFYVGYHWVIEKSGEAVRTRFDTEIGAHTVGQNDQSIGICLAGNFDEESPTEAQTRALGTLLSHYCDILRLDEHNIFPHRAWKDTHCYGDNLDDNWAARVYLEDRIRTYKTRLDNLDIHK